MEVERIEPLLPEIVELHGRWRANKVALIFEDERLTYSELNRKLNQVANGLKAVGIGKGGSVAVLMKNEMATMIVMLGVIKSGAAMVPLNLSIGDDTLETQINDSGCLAVFATTEETKRIEKVRDRLINVPPSNLFVAGAALEGWNRFETWLDEQSEENPKIEIQPDEVMNIIYSSGTTGVPKGITHSHKDRINTIYDLSIQMGFRSDSVFASAIGLYSNISYLCLLIAVFQGGTLVLAEKFDAKMMLAALARHRCTHLFMVPLTYQMILEHPDFADYDLSSLDTVCSVGSPLFRNLKDQMLNLLKCNVTELYGLTEGFFTFLNSKDIRKKIGSVGLPPPGYDLRILDEDRKELPIGSQGEIVGRSRNLMVGYHNLPETTEKAFYVDEMGRQWLCTGDIGKLDEDGFLYITDRKKDMIISGGQNIFPTDIEAVAVRHPQISEIAVVGVPHEKWGETPIAFVVPAKDADTTELDFQQWINERVGKRQRINQLKIVESLPRNPTGKILKRELQKPYLEPGLSDC